MRLSWTGGTFEEAMNRRVDIWNLCGIFLMAVILAMATFSLYVHTDKQTDFLGIYAATSAFNLGLNPYDTAALSRMAHEDMKEYVYPPYTLYLFRPFTWFSFAAAARIYLTLKFIALGGLLYLWHRLFDLTRCRGLLWIIIPLAYNGAIIFDLRAGNISIFEQLLIWMAFFFYTRKKIALFGIVIVLAAAFKLTPVLLLGLLVTRCRKKEWAYAVLFGGALMALIASSAVVSSNLFGGFLKNVQSLGSEHGEFNPSTWALICDFTRWFQVKTGTHLPLIVPLSIYSVLVAGALGISAAAFNRLKSLDSLKGDLWRICLICFLFAVTIPRFKNYSYILLIAPTLFVFILCNWMNPLVPLCGLLAIFSYRNFQMQGSALQPFFQVTGEYYCLILAWVFWGLCCYCMQRETKPEEMKIETSRP